MRARIKGGPLGSWALSSPKGVPARSRRDRARSHQLERARARGELDRFELEKLDFFEAIRQAYLARASAEEGRIAVIDATLSIVVIWNFLTIKFISFLLVLEIDFETTKRVNDTPTLSSSLTCQTIHPMFYFFSS